jgi:hypothetical protein
LLERKANHEDANEFGASEAGIKYNGTKHIVKGGVKLPKALKDMLDKLISNNNGSYEGLATFGLQHSGNNTQATTFRLQYSGYNIQATTFRLERDIDNCRQTKEVHYKNK